MAKIRKLHYVLKAYTFSNFISFTKENKRVLRWQLSIYHHIYHLINFDTLEIIYKEEKIKITNREKLFLELLTQNKNRVSKYEEIDENV